MAKLKRARVTADDLLRMQEDRPRKRPRETPEDPNNSGSNDTDVESPYDENEALESVSDNESSSSLEYSPSSSSAPEAPSTMDRLSRVTPKHRTEITDPSIQHPLLGTSFEMMNISPALQAALSRMSIRVPTEIQAACIPPLLAGRDCIGNAKTGSGKTVAFAIPILQRLSDDPYGVFALVLTPTRELAFQISEQFAVLGAALSVRTSVIVGGMDMMAQALELDGRPHIIVATPGRIVDHLRSSSGEWDLSRVKFLVLDEADRLLTSTFAPDLAHLFGILPKERQTCLFTATLTPPIDALAEAPPRPGKMKPFIHKMESTVETVATLKQHYVLVPSHVRESYLYHLLCHPPENTISMRRDPPKPAKTGKNKIKINSRSSQKNTSIDDDELIQPPPTIIFCTKPRTAAYLTNLLKTLSIRSTALHSRLTQRERLNSLSLFRASVVPVLVSTDVGARGLDIEDVAIVINWDMPNEPEEYTHRVGRTARAGKSGVAISFVTEKDEERMVRIEERIGTKLVGMTLPEDKVLQKLNAVSTAKRLANMELHDSDFGKREEIHQIKNQKRRGDGS
ncbi:P-loop containing nucleoside triphosphate hydrolase protein [Hygrophoropsis aurantiaca]|uniref:P-loop containing nucleoside triphosphate hydrolase protein n=1 Tax=Hygrophoropsis aurantiaca TaxID=72124 RepID=A0ACB8A4S6_9AGAM|nr:P-loop containing nucleoside triphosphate hydrolase protein [Hygrophoropsis aurantiaca]